MNPIEREVEGVCAAFAKGPEYGYAKLLYALNRIYRTGHEDAYRSFEPEWQKALDAWGECEKRIGELEAQVGLARPGGTPVIRCGGFSPDNRADGCTRELGHEGWHECWKDEKLLRAWRPRE